MLKRYEEERARESERNVNNFLTLHRSTYKTEKMSGK